MFTVHSPYEAVCQLLPLIHAIRNEADKKIDALNLSIIIITFFCLWSSIFLSTVPSTADGYTSDEQNQDYTRIAAHRKLKSDS